MIIKRLLQFNLVVSVFIAIAFIFAPKPTLALYGMSGDQALYAIAQYFGTMHASFIVLIWLALRADDARFQRYLAIAFFAGDLAGSAVLLIAQLRGVMNPMGWALVGLSCLFAIGYGYGALKKLPE